MRVVGVGDEAEMGGVSSPGGWERELILKSPDGLKSGKMREG